ncbi:MAG: hypothetical protein J5696_11070 [Lachnospiraceae bacterium]|nr:hypothetical protein [Lachnospiraceae bacterium]
MTSSTGDESASVADDSASTVDAGQTSVSNGSGKFEDYWEGDDYFNIEAYALDNGCDVMWIGSDGYECERADATALIVFYGDWTIQVMPANILATNSNHTDPQGLSVPTGTKKVSICKENNVELYDGCCECFKKMLETLKSSS